MSVSFLCSSWERELRASGRHLQLAYKWYNLFSVNQNYLHSGHYYYVPISGTKGKNGTCIFCCYKKKKKPTYISL